VFGSADAHNHLLYLRFWKQFSEYKYTLMCHLDALVFRDELLTWCATDVDYIGLRLCTARIPLSRLHGIESRGHSNFSEGSEPELALRDWLCRSEFLSVYYDQIESSSVEALWRMPLEKRASSAAVSTKHGG
jgi:hypothetical protein